LLRLSEVASRRGLPRDLVRNLGQRALDLVLGFRRSEREQPGTDGFGCLQQQIAKHAQGDIKSQTKLLGRALVGLRIADKGREAAF
jgi:hypothetical protein